MKTTKLISLLLAFVLVLSAFSACANPPSTSSPSAVPEPADQINKEETKKPDPVDLSVLSEEELGKMKFGLLDELKLANKNDVLRVNFSFSSVISYTELENLALKKKELIKSEMKTELNELRQKNNRGSVSAEEKETVSERIAELERILSDNGILYRLAVSEVLDETYGGILQDFIEDYDLNIDDVTGITDSMMYITFVDVSAQKIIEIAKDTRVTEIELSSKRR